MNITCIECGKKDKVWGNKDIESKFPIRIEGRGRLCADCSYQHIVIDDWGKYGIKFRYVDYGRNYKKGESELDAE